MNYPEKKDIPNAITISRIITCFLFILFETLYLVIGDIYIHFFAIVSLIICFLSDYFDGKIARRYSHVSKWGMKWDPIIDGVVITILNIYLVILMIVSNFPNKWIFITLFSIIAVRNYIISQGFKTLLGIAKRSSEDVREKVKNIGHVTKQGKQSTAVQMVAITSFFLLNSLSIQIPIFSLIFIAGFSLSMYSGFDYAIKGYKVSKILWQKNIFPKQKNIYRVGAIIARVMPF